MSVCFPVMVRPYSSLCGAAFRAWVIGAVLVFLHAGLGTAQAVSPSVEVTAPSGPVRVGERFTVLVSVGWDGEGGGLEVGRPSFESPENLRLQSSRQESRTVLRDGSPFSTKEYRLDFAADEAGRVRIGPFSLNAKRGDEELALTGKAVNIEVVRGVSRSLVMWGIWIGVLILGVVMYLLIRRYGRSNPAALL